MSHKKRVWKRVGAFAFDFLFIRSIIEFFKHYTGFKIPEPTTAFESIVIIFFVLLVYIVVQTIYSVIMYKWFSGTLGKIVLAISVVDIEEYKVPDSVIIKREIYKWTFFYATLGIYGLISLIMLIKKKRTYHEFVSNTYIKK